MQCALVGIVILIIIGSSVADSNLGLATSPVGTPPVTASFANVSLVAQNQPTPDVDQWIDDSITGLERDVISQVLAALPDTDAYRQNLVLLLEDGVFVNTQELRDIYERSPDGSSTTQTTARRTSSSSSAQSGRSSASSQVDQLVEQQLRDALPQNSVYTENLVILTSSDECSTSDLDGCEDFTVPNDATGLRSKYWSGKPADYDTG